MKDPNLIFDLKEKIEQKKLLQERLSKKKEQLKAETYAHKQLQSLLKKEYDDVIRLEEGKGLASLFYSFLGNKVEKIEKEKLEYLAIKLKSDLLLETISKLEKETEKLNQEIISLDNPEVEYKKIIEEKTYLLVSTQDAQYLELSSKTEQTYAELIEIKEALSAGKKAAIGLEKALYSLQKAKNWGTWDIIGGKGLSSAIKHSHIDNAHAAIRNVQYLLKSFQRELKDVSFINTAGLHIQLHSIESVADIFFDNLISDWMVQSKINRSLTNCTKTLRTIKSITSKLAGQSKTLQTEYNQNKKDITNYLEIS